MGGVPEDVKKKVLPYVDVLANITGPALDQYTPEGFASALAGYAKEIAPKLILASATQTGRDFLPRVAVLLGSGIASDVTGIRWSEDPVKFIDYISKLEEVSGVEIKGFASLTEALRVRHDYFAEAGCVISDHGIEQFHADDYTEKEVGTIFLKVLSGSQLAPGEISKFKSAMLYELAVMDSEKGWVQQFHYGAIRNNNSRMFAQLGPDTGFDSIGDFTVARTLSKFLDRLDAGGNLTKTILYNLNPRDNELIATMIGNFQDGSTPGKIQFGAGWWFLDQETGMINQLNALSLMGLLSRFVGMLTDSRSFVSYPRHEYFRRILCNMFGDDIEKGKLPASEMATIGKMVEMISYYNAKHYFGF